MWIFFFFFPPPLKNASWTEARSYFFNLSQFYWQFLWDFFFIPEQSALLGRGLLLWGRETKVRSLPYLFSSILEWILKPVVTKEQTHGMRKLFTLWCLLSLLFYIFARSTPAASLTGTHTGCRRLKAVVLLSPISFASVAWESSCEHPWPCTITERELLEALEKRLVGQETSFLHWCLLASRSLSGSAPFLLVENQICSLIPLGLADLVSCLK